MISLIFWIIAALCYGTMMTLEHHHGTSLFSKAKPYSFFGRNSWTRKYKDNNPREGQKFFGSTTFFVWLTDGYHLMQFFMLTFLTLSVVLFYAYRDDLEYYIAIFVVYRISWSLGFMAMYDWILVKRK